MLNEVLVTTVLEKEQAVLKVATPKKSEVLTIRILIIIGCLCITAFLFWFFGKPRLDHPWLYWPLTFALLFKFFRLLHEWYHYWGIKPMPDRTTVIPITQHTVDVITTYCHGEPREMVMDTLLAIKNMRYPHETYLGDEATDPELQDFCSKHGIHYFTRNNRINAKAGNINNILSHTKGDICLILDPDHQPHPLLLERILPHFNRPEVGFVQTVQAYKNQKSSLIAFGAAEQTYHFYGPLMMGMSNYGTSQAIGANCAFRRKALDSIGGHAAGLAEDMHTSMLLHANGWKSIYIPEILTRGLVPSTLSAYYKQQLKWSRGTLELLFFVLPKIWSKLSWRQRLHYLTLPFYYLAALVILIDLTIPTISLFIARAPWLISLDKFILFITPVVCLTILIRQYAQRWLLENQERGFVLVGGLLRISTWWIYLTGIITTLFRVKIPYIPTPKKDNPQNEFWLCLPNLLVTCLSILAVIYGLSIDYTPFSFVMALFATINALILLFCLIISQQKLLISLKEFIKNKKEIHKQSKQFRIFWWHVRHSLYYLIRTRAVLLLSVVVLTLYFYQGWLDKTSLKSQYFYSLPAESEEAFYSGIYLPAIQEQQQLTLFHKAFPANTFNPDIVSIYWPWQENPDLPINLLNQIFAQQKIPMISWEPWAPVLASQAGNSDFLDDILDGKYDADIKDVAKQIALLQKPVFFRFAHQFDNPYYPWSVAITKAPDKFKRTWQYLVEKFWQQGASNAIWVYNPWQPEAMLTFYPGDKYVDWLGIKALNYTNFNHDRRWQSFKSIYQPFKQIIEQSPLFENKPVMLTEFGSQGKAEEKIQWIQEAAKNIQQDKQIKAMVYFYFDEDKSLPPHLTANTLIPSLNWQLSSQHVPTYKRKSKLSILHSKPSVSEHQLPDTKLVSVSFSLSTIKGVIYQPVDYWNEALLPLTKKQLEKDFRLMQELQINTIYRPVFDIYRINTFKLAEQFNIQVIQEIKETDVLAIKKLTTQKSLLAWSVGTLLPAQVTFELPEYHLKFLKQLKEKENLATQIKKQSQKPVVANIDFYTLKRNAPLIFSTLKHVDVVGISLYKQEELQELKELWKHYNPKQVYYINGMSQTPQQATTGITDKHDKVAGTFHLSHQKDSLSKTSEYKGYMIGYWMDQVLGAPQSGIISFDSRVKACFKDHLQVDTEIYLYSNDPTHALQTDKNYKFYAVTNNNRTTDSLWFEWYVFDMSSGHEVVKSQNSKNTQEMEFTPLHTGNYLIILRTNEKQKLLYNTYLHIKSK